MTLQFGRKSKLYLATVTPGLNMVAHEALAMEIMDFAVIEGFRQQSKQDEYFKSEKSKVEWPNSKHNAQPLSYAMDCVPWINGAISWRKDHCCVLAGIIQCCAKKLGIRIRWGGNWDMDLEPITDQDFQDLVHFEIVPVPHMDWTSRSG